MDLDLTDPDRVYVFGYGALVDAAVNGVLVPVGEQDIETLDRRERNYDRVEVTDRIIGRVAGTVWAYVGKEVARRRFDRAREEGRAVINASYRATVRAAFADRGEDALQTYIATTRPPEVPERSLRRVAEAPS